MDLWILDCANKFYRRMAGYLSVKGSLTLRGSCSKTTTLGTQQNLQRNGRSFTFWNGLKSVEMLWKVLKRAVHAGKLTNITKLNQCRKEEWDWARIPPTPCTGLIILEIFVWSYSCSREEGGDGGVTPVIVSKGIFFSDKGHFCWIILLSY